MQNKCPALDSSPAHVYAPTQPIPINNTAVKFIPSLGQRAGGGGREGGRGRAARAEIAQADCDVSGRPRIKRDKFDSSARGNAGRRSPTTTTTTTMTTTMMMTMTRNSRSSACSADGQWTAMP